MLSFAEQPFELAFNQLIEARVSSTNGEGPSLPSPVNTDGARVRARPGKAYAPYEGDLTSHNQIEVVWPALTTATDTGNSEIVAY